MSKIFIFILFGITLSTSCMVSKKKFEALDAQRNKTIDSLSVVLNSTRDDYNKHRQIYARDAKQKEYWIDSVSAEIKRLSADTLNLSTSLRKAISNYEAERKKLTEVEKRLNEKDAEQKKRNRQIDSLQQILLVKQNRLAQLEQMIEKNKDEAANLKKILNEALKSFDASELNVYIKDGKVYVAMEEKLLFKSGSSAIDKRGKEAIIKLGKILETNIETEILIEGHTDNVGADAFNWKLSNERALSVVQILTENTKILPERITASGRGMHKPVADNSSPEGKQKNRRIEIILVPKLNSLYDLMNK